jgi:hypothetical protein
MLSGLPGFVERVVKRDRSEADDVGHSEVRNDAALFEAFANAGCFVHVRLTNAVVRYSILQEGGPFLQKPFTSGGAGSKDLRGLDLT